MWLHHLRGSTTPGLGDQSTSLCSFKQMCITKGTYGDLVPQSSIRSVFKLDAEFCEMQICLAFLENKLFSLGYAVQARLERVLRVHPRLQFMTILSTKNFLSVTKVMC